MSTSLVKKLFASDWKFGRPPLYLWHDPSVTQADKKLIFKLDITILVYACLSFWVKYLDSANLFNAYVSGLKEDLPLQPKEYTLCVTLFTVGTILFAIPSNLILTKLPPRIWLPGCELVWAIATLFTYKVRNAQELYAIRFIVGAMEGSCFVGCHYVFGAWYTKKELGKRAALFAMCAYGGTLFSGFIQAGIMRTLDGRNGLPGWRWLFIIDGVITLVVTIFGFIVFPDLPETTKAWYLTEEDKKRCVERLREDGKEHEIDSFGWDVLKRLFGTWQFWVLTPVWVFWSNTLGKYTGTVFPQWLKAQGTYSIYQINMIPTAVSGFNIVMLLLIAWFIDVSGRRLYAIYFCLTIQIIGTIIVLVYDVSDATMIVGQMLGAMDGPTSPLVLAWANILCYGDKQKRAFLLAAMNAIGNSSSAIINQFAYNAVTGPRFRKGVIVSLVFVIFELIGLTFCRFIEVKMEPEEAESVEDADSLKKAKDLDEKLDDGRASVVRAAL